MIQKLLMISGKKQSGKSSLRNFIVGKLLVDNGVWDTFNISTKGELMIPVEGKKNLEILDLNQNTYEFKEYAYENIWPLAKTYSFANALKYLAIDLFGLDYEQCFGTDEDKNKQTNIRWSSISFALPPRVVGGIKSDGNFDNFLTGREFLETFGTNICRKIFEDCWAEKTKKEIIRDGYPFSIIDDVRCPNELTIFDGEFETVKVRLLRDPHAGTSDIEKMMDGKDDEFDLVIPEEVTIIEKQDLVVNYLTEKGWL